MSIAANGIVRYGVWLPAFTWFAAIAVFVVVVESGPAPSGEQGMARAFDTLAIFGWLALLGFFVFIAVLASSARVLYISRRENVGRLNLISAAVGILIATALIAAFLVFVAKNIF